MRPEQRSHEGQSCRDHRVHRFKKGSDLPAVIPVDGFMTEDPACYERRLGSQRAIADSFGISLSFVEKLLRRHCTTGEVAPKPHAGGQRPRLDAAAQAQVRRLVHNRPDATLAELCTRIGAETRVPVSVPTLCRVLQRLGLPRKKSRFTPRNMTRHGSSRHERRIKRSSIPSTSEGATDTDVFQAYVEQILGPTLRPGDIVVLDNLRVHNVHQYSRGD